MREASTGKGRGRGLSVDLLAFFRWALAQFFRFAVCCSSAGSFSSRALLRQQPDNRGTCGELNY